MAESQSPSKPTTWTPKDFNQYKLAYHEVDWCYLKENSGIFNQQLEVVTYLYLWMD